MKQQGRDAMKWLVNALLHVHLSPEIKKAERQLLAVRDFTVNLRFMELWDVVRQHWTEDREDIVLMKPVKERLTTLGHKLEADYEARNLRGELGAFSSAASHIKRPAEKRQGLVVPAPPPGYAGQPEHRREFAYYTYC